MRVNGTGKTDYLHGGSSDDSLNGGKGIDFLRGWGGDDTLTGGSGGDRFIMSPGGGEDTITDFNAAEGDKVIFEYGNFPDAMFIGSLVDGMKWTSESGGECWIEGGDYNGDGVYDTEIYVNDVSVTLLGVSPGDLTGDMFLGG